MYDLERITIEFASAVICLILVRFMVKPYSVTRESRYLGLPLGFGFLGVTYLISALVYFQPSLLGANAFYFQLVARAFAFFFMAVTYYFSKKNSNSRNVWNLTMALMIIALIALILLGIMPNIDVQGYQATSSYVRVFNIICISYICIHTLSGHAKKPDPETLLIPIGFILLAVGQYSLLIWSIDKSISALFGGLIIRLIGLTIFLFVSYQTFLLKKKGV